MEEQQCRTAIATTAKASRKEGAGHHGGDTEALHTRARMHTIQSTLRRRQHHERIAVSGLRPRTQRIHRRADHEEAEAAVMSAPQMTPKEAHRRLARLWRAFDKRLRELERLARPHTYQTIAHAIHAGHRAEHCRRTIQARCTHRTGIFTNAMDEHAPVECMACGARYDLKGHRTTTPGAQST